jgi:HSP20 family protein
MRALVPRLTAHLLRVNQFEEMIKMTTLDVWDPFTEVRRTMNDLMGQAFGDPWYNRASAYDAATTFPLEMWETSDAVHVKVALPGIKPEDVEITFTAGVLHIRASRELEQSNAVSWYRREIPYGSFDRALSLPTSVDSDRAEARYEHGMLSLTLPKAESVRPKQIRISNADGPRVHQLN